MTIQINFYEILASNVYGIISVSVLWLYADNTVFQIPARPVVNIAVNKINI